MTEEKTDPIDVLASLIKQKRDELALTMHLASKDAQDEWTKLEQKYGELEKKAAPLSGAIQESAAAAGEQAQNVADTAANLLASELNEGYEKLKKLVSPEVQQAQLGEVANLLKRTRDELALKMHLASKDAQDEWENLEKKYGEMEKKVAPLSGAIQESTAAAGEQAKKVADTAANLLASELSEGYAKLKKLLD